MNTFQLLDIAFSALEQRKHSSPGMQHGRKSALSGAQELPGEDPPTTDLGTAEAGVLRYFTVKVERGGRVFYEHVQAPHTWAAGKVAWDANPGAISTQVVREITRAEFDRFTKRSP